MTFIDKRPFAFDALWRVEDGTGTENRVRIGERYIIAILPGNKLGICTTNQLKPTVQCVLHVPESVTDLRILETAQGVAVFNKDNCATVIFVQIETTTAHIQVLEAKTVSDDWAKCSATSSRKRLGAAPIELQLTSLAVQNSGVAVDDLVFDNTGLLMLLHETGASASKLSRLVTFGNAEFAGLSEIQGAVLDSDQMESASMLRSVPVKDGHVVLLARAHEPALLVIKTNTARNHVVGLLLIYGNPSDTRRLFRLANASKTTIRDVAVTQTGVIMLNSSNEFFTCDFDRPGGFAVTHLPAAGRLPSHIHHAYSGRLNLLTNLIHVFPDGAIECGSTTRHRLHFTKVAEEIGALVTTPQLERTEELDYAWKHLSPNAVYGDHSVTAQVVAQLAVTRPVPLVFTNGLQSVRIAMETAILLDEAGHHGAAGAMRFNLLVFFQQCKQAVVPRGEDEEDQDIRNGHLLAQEVLNGTPAIATRLARKVAASGKFWCRVNLQTLYHLAHPDLDTFPSFAAIFGPLSLHGHGARPSIDLSDVDTMYVEEPRVFFVPATTESGNAKRYNLLTTGRYEMTPNKDYAAAYGEWAPDTAWSLHREPGTPIDTTMEQPRLLNRVAEAAVNDIFRSQPHLPKHCASIPLRDVRALQPSVLTEAMLHPVRFAGTTTRHYICDIGTLSFRKILPPVPGNNPEVDGLFFLCGFILHASTSALPLSKAPLSFGFFSWLRYANRTLPGMLDRTGLALLRRFHTSPTEFVQQAVARAKEVIPIIKQGVPKDSVTGVVDEKSTVFRNYVRALTDAVDCLGLSISQAAIDGGGATRKALDELQTLLNSGLPGRPYILSVASGFEIHMDMLLAQEARDTLNYVIGDDDSSSEKRRRTTEAGRMTSVPVN